MSLPSAQSPVTLTFDDSIAWLTVDDPSRPVNTLSSGVVDAFEAALGEIEARRTRAPDPKADAVRGVVIVSGKPGVWVAGADLDEVREISYRSDFAERVLEMVFRGHDLIRRLSELGCPTVAAIDGACLGGGLELALGCDFRVATDTDKTRLGLPEVQLGLIPGLGGTRRLPRLIGVPEALDLILTGKRLDAKRAKTRGLVDAVCHPADLRRASLELVEQGTRTRKRSITRRATDLVARLPVAKGLIYQKARETVEEKTGGHYPAPRVAIEVVEKGMALPLRRALDLEAGAFAQLVGSRVSKNLVGIYFAKNAVEARAKELSEGAREVETVGVLGAGLMGAGIAQGLAARGVSVVMKDRDTDALARGLEQAAKVFDQKVRRRKMSETEKKTAMARIHPTTSYRPFRGVDLVIEAVFEDLEVKRRVLGEVGEFLPEGAVLASNTSTIPIGRLAEGSEHPERVVGMHFFSPVEKMPLLEVIRHPSTSDEALATAVAVGRRMGKTVIVVDDGPGFFTSRVLGPYLDEAARLLTEGARMDQIDGALRRWGFPVGPLELLDEVGLDIAAHASRVVSAELPNRPEPPPVFSTLIDTGRLGRKSGRGFYDYSGERKHPDLEVYDLLGWQPRRISEQEIIERCVLRMMDETARAMDVQDGGVIEDPQAVDIGVVFGLGFPPFRGGILREMDRLGAGHVVERLRFYADRHGERFRPAPLLVRRAQMGERFYADSPGEGGAG